MSLGGQFTVSPDTGKGQLVPMLEPTRGGMLVQYYVDGFLIYERVR